MKKILTHSKKGILMVTLFVTTLSFANEVSIYTVENVAAKTTALTINYVKEGSLLSLKDNYGTVLYKETIKATGRYSKGFDLSFLPSGSYKFEVDKDLEIKVIPFTVASGVANFNKAKETTLYKPMVKVEDDIVYVSKSFLDASPLNVDIYFVDSNNNSELIFSETIKADSKNIERIYKLEGLRNGAYNIVLDSNNRQIVKTIK
ncbi:hypothetical protein [Tamlana sp. I1]|uniref:hypothetical protein n=1 Tax=Tamlana sp. I1 TaxID=2762061 RepID=UPI00189058DF|nr:hypothetical protein [Tamlana sp. I1]